MPVPTSSAPAGGALDCFMLGSYSEVVGASLSRVPPYLCQRVGLFVGDRGRRHGWHQKRTDRGDLPPRGSRSHAPPRAGS
ncbi:hypothetical protein NOCA2240069 [metagenome]|uniref:Uncharacterized protein n=1 Tax=metagenome TaxID=256318 RepID=A0A2P2BZU2_9ZZZZ